MGPSYVLGKAENGRGMAQAPGQNRWVPENISVLVQ